jgi:uncharacterized membrane protein YGL010W
MMNTNTEIEMTTMRPIDRWFANYSADHVNVTNQKIHYIAVPLILWSVTALLWCIPVPGTWFGPGLWAALPAYAAWMFYNRASRPIGYGMLAILFIMLCADWWLFGYLGRIALLQIAISVFVLAWIAQFIGHKIEGKKPSFLTDLVYLLIGPAWILGKVYRKLGLKF